MGIFAQATGAGSGLFGVRQAKRATLPALRQQAQQLQAQNVATGAPGIEEDKPGIFRTLIDLLSRPNYAIAGLFEELAGEEPSVTRGVKRALAEIFSGVGGIEGEKRAFGEVLEKLGVGTKTLADAFPALEGTWVGNFGSRGAAGLALDIATDPLTYMTFGASTGLRITTSKGIRYLNKTGIDEFGKISRQVADETRGALATAVDKGDRVLQGNIMEKSLAAAEDAFEAAFTRGDDIAEELLEKGGAKLFGAQIPLSDKLGVPLRKGLSMLPEAVAKPAVEGATQMRDGFFRVMNGIFSPEGPLSKLPQPLRERAVRLTNTFFRSSTAHRAHLINRMAPMERRYRALEKADKAIGERWYDIREGVVGRSAFKSPEEAALFDETMALYDSMGRTAFEHGVLKTEQLLPNYIFHQYKNVEDLAQFHARPGVKLEPGNKASFEKQRRFESYRQAQEVSKSMHDQAVKQLGKGEADRLYPVLEPEWDVFKNMQAYIGQHSTALARKAWSEEMVVRFGKSLKEFDFDEAFETTLKAKKTPGAPDWFNPEKVPLRRAIDEFDIEDQLVEAFGKDGAQYVAVKGTQTGHELVYLPKEIAKALEGVNSSLFNTKDYKEFGKLLRGFDWLNNNFKWGVYTIWPASASRDAYSNIALSMLRIGAAALDPKKHADTVLMMAGRNPLKQFANSGFTLGQLRELSKSLGVWVPGQVFVEQTGKFKLGRFRRALTEKRALIENEARVQLWMEEIRRGADPRLAADTVGRFLFNYGEVSRVERDLFRRLIPFYTFTRKNVELQWKTLRSKPGLAINQAKPFRGYESENEQMISWEGEGLKIRLNRDGKTVHMLNGIDLPIRNLDTIWAGGFGETGRRMMGMLTPILKTPIEAVTGRDFFTGGDLKRARGDTMGRIIEATRTPQAIKDWMGFKKDFDLAGRPRYTFDGVRYALLVRSWMFSRVFSTSDRQFRNYLGDANIAGALTDFMTGIRYRELNLDEQGRAKLQRRIRQLQQAGVRRGNLREHTVAYQPRER